VSTRADSKNKKSSSSTSAFMKSTRGGDEESLPGDFESLVLPSNIHYYRIEESKWATLQGFLTAAACALAEQQQPQQQQHQVHTCARSHDSNQHNYALPFSSSKTVSNKTTSRSSPLVDRCMAIAERLCPPTASSITAFLGHAQLQRLLDPSLPHPFWSFLRYIFTLILSIGAIFLGVWSLRFLMFAFGIAVCVASDATLALFNVVNQIETICIPMVPDTWALPIGFSLVGLYITIQISVIAGVTLRHVLLKWDEKAVGMWFVVCLGYTVFVYFARYLLTVLVSCLVPFSNGEFGAVGGEVYGSCVPTIENPCY
jgi:hypothetical protein